jgi:hypothetical protein
MRPNLSLPVRKRSLATVATLALGLAAGHAPAQTTASGGLPPWSRFASVTPVHQWDADIDRGGSMGVTGAIVRVGTAGMAGPATFAGVTLSYDYFDYHFSNPVAFGGAAPWSTVQRVGFSVPINHQLNDGWAITFVPSFDWFGERGAKGSESLAWGAVFAASKTFAEGRRLGLGLGAFDRFEDTTVFPYVVVDWPLTPRLKLTNPAAAGPTGPAGLELRYRTDSGWDLGAGGAYRSTRFRLSSSGQVPNGVGEERGLPLFLRASRELGPATSLSVYAGAIVAGSLRLEDSNGNKLVGEDFGTAPFVAATLNLRF